MTFCLLLCLSLYLWDPSFTDYVQVQMGRYMLFLSMLIYIEFRSELDWLRGLRKDGTAGKSRPNIPQNLSTVPTTCGLDNFGREVYCTSRKMLNLSSEIIQLTAAMQTRGTGWIRQCSLTVAPLISCFNPCLSSGLVLGYGFSALSEELVVEWTIIQASWKFTKHLNCLPRSFYLIPPLVDLSFPPEGNVHWENKESPKCNHCFPDLILQETCKEKKHWGTVGLK